jgi:hypothetical protein
MIVNLQPTGWEIIYHRAHALLAAQIAGLWPLDTRPHYRYETIAAISHHDDLEKEWEGDQLTPAGAPLDFTLERQGGAERLQQHVDESLYRGRWVALLTSMHLCFLHQGREKEADIAHFLNTQRQLQQQWREELDVNEDTAKSAYDFMRWCDRLSLILCQHQVPAGGRQLEIITMATGESYSLFQQDSGTLGITPWPFARDRATVTVEACDLSQLAFESNEALTEALKSAPRRVLSWCFEQPT